MTAYHSTQKVTAIGTLAACVGAACALLLSSNVTKFEGTRLQAYRDVAGIWTICRGETLNVHQGDTATAQQCSVQLDVRLTQFAKPVLDCTPSLKGHDYQLAAAVSLAYNIGAKAYCGSTAARLFNGGRWDKACDAFILWDRAGGKVVQGLVNRRAAERALCLHGLAQ